MIEFVVVVVVVVVVLLLELRVLLRVRVQIRPAAERLRLRTLGQLQIRATRPVVRLRERGHARRRVRLPLARRDLFEGGVRREAAVLRDELRLALPGERGGRKMGGRLELGSLWVRLSSGTQHGLRES